MRTSTDSPKTAGGAGGGGTCGRCRVLGGPAFLHAHAEGAWVTVFDTQMWRTGVLWVKQKRIWWSSSLGSRPSRQRSQSAGRGAEHSERGALPAPGARCTAHLGRPPGGGKASAGHTQVALPVCGSSSSSSRRRRKVSTEVPSHQFFPPQLLCSAFSSCQWLQGAQWCFPEDGHQKRD